MLYLKISEIAILQFTSFLWEYSLYLQVLAEEACLLSQIDAQAARENLSKAQSELSSAANDRVWVANILKYSFYILYIWRISDYIKFSYTFLILKIIEIIDKIKICRYRCSYNSLINPFVHLSVFHRDNSKTERLSCNFIACSGRKKRFTLLVFKQTSPIDLYCHVFNRQS